MDFEKLNELEKRYISEAVPFEIVDNFTGKNKSYMGFPAENLDGNKTYKLGFTPRKGNDGKVYFIPNNKKTEDKMKSYLDNKVENSHESISKLVPNDIGNKWIRDSNGNLKTLTIQDLEFSKNKMKNKFTPKVKEEIIPAEEKKEEMIETPAETTETVEDIPEEVITAVDKDNLTTEGPKKKNSKIDYEKKNEIERKKNEFMSKNPSITGAIFDKDSGYSFSDKLNLALQTLGSGTVNAIRSAVAGFNGKEAPERFESPAEKIFKDAQMRAAERKQSEFDEQQKGLNEKANIKSRIESNSELQKLPSNIQNKMVEDIWGGNTMTERDFERFLKSNLSPEQIESGEFGLIKDKTTGTIERTLGFDSIFDSYLNSKNTSEIARGNELAKLNIGNAYLDNITKKLSTEAECQNLINNYSKLIKELQNDLIELDKQSKTWFLDYAQKYRSVVAGLSSSAGSEQLSKSKDFGAGVNASVSGGIAGFGKVSGSASANFSAATTKSNQNSYNTDNAEEKVLQAINDGESMSDEIFNSAKAGMKNLINAQIKSLEEAIESVKEKETAIKSKTKIDDGIIEAPHMEQAVVREDGSVIELNPEDSILATKDELTAPSDDGSSVYPIDLDETAILIKKNLNHPELSVNDFDYYRNLLKGVC